MLGQAKGKKGGKRRNKKREKKITDEGDFLGKIGKISFLGKNWM